MRELVQSAPFPSVAVGPPPWRDGTLRCVQRAQHLVRRSHTAALSSAARYRRPFKSRLPDLVAHGGNENVEKEFDDHEKSNVRPKSAVTSLSSLAVKGPFPPPALRDQSAVACVGLACEYMRNVREVEGHLRRQAGRVSQEATKLEHQRERLEKLLRSFRKAVLVNQQSADGRTLRPTANEARKDGADVLLSHERKTLKELKWNLEAMLRNTLTQQQALALSSRQLCACAFERSRAIELLPQHGSASATIHPSPSPLSMQPDPSGPLTAECKQALESSSDVLHKSEQLRESVKELMRDAVIKQTTLHHSVNEGILRKISESVSLQNQLALSSASVRQAIFRKQRQVQCASYSQGRVLGPVSKVDLFCRERLDRPVVQMYGRHQISQLPESRLLTQGSAMLKHHLESAEKTIEDLQASQMHLVDDARAKRSAMGVDSAVVRLRRRNVLPVCDQGANP
ncbi:tektin-like protein 1 [Brachyhypopomus gauderio]|uniref:tektin-like protein 1 n=1 Tax=Brachyhypopomus gauderio TaxID=698409 RepID=UPI0040427C22